jgi:hypothetical protein
MTDSEYIEVFRVLNKAQTRADDAFAQLAIARVEIADLARQLENLRDEHQSQTKLEWCDGCQVPLNLCWCVNKTIGGVR